MSDIYLGLVHWPIYDRAQNKVATNVTHFDIHDIARACRSYGVKKYYIINRMQEQLMFVHRVLEHWKLGDGLKLNPMRCTALYDVYTCETVEKLLGAWEGEKPYVVATAARRLDFPSVSFKQVREWYKPSHGEKGPKKPLLLLFGTGFGLHDELLDSCDAVLEPIMGAAEDEYRHLSVRSAVSICLDRILGTW